jgi:3-hydroxyisobutyrate dehydrogenase
MAGGEPETVALCRPVFATYGDPVVYLGRFGSGQLTKLLNNLLFTAHLATAADAPPGAILNAADATLALMSHPR